MPIDKKEKYDLISISHYFPPRVGGLENMAFNLLNGLSKKGIRCIALFGTDKKGYSEDTIFQTQNFKVFSIFGNTYPLFGVNFFLNVFKLLNQNPNSKVIIHSRHLTSSIWTSLACILKKHPYTVIEHNGGQVYFKSTIVTNLVNWIDRNFFGLVLQNAEDILAVSNTSRKWISKNFGISMERIGVIFNSFDTNYNLNKITEKENIVVFASKWIRVKDPNTTLKAYLSLAKEFPDWKFIMAGEGSDLDTVDIKMPDNVKIYSQLLSQKDLFTLLKRSKIYINSSLSEGLALGILEAISFGNIPVISSAKSNLEIAKILNTKEFTFIKGSSNDLVNTVRAAIYKSRDTKYLKSLIQRNEQTFSKEEMVNRYYKRILPRHYESTTMKTLSIVIPLYNEELTIGKLLEKISSIQLPNGISKEIIIVDDSSKDRSREEVEKFIDNSHTKDEYILLKNRTNKGKSQTVKKGILASTGELVVTQDADLEYEPEDLIMFVNEFLQNHNTDVIYGNRFNKKNNFTNSIHRQGNRFVTLMSNFFTRPRGFAPNDMETCYKMVRGDIMRSIFKTLESVSNFGLEPEVTAKLARYRKPNGKKLIFKQIDIYYNPRTISQGKKMRWFKHGTEALLEILYFNSTPFTVEEYLHDKKIKRMF